MKELLAEFRRAGLLEPLEVAPSCGVIRVPKEVPSDLAGRLIQRAGPPPWDEKLYYQLKAEYEQDLAHLARLKAAAIAKARANGENVY